MKVDGRKLSHAKLEEIRFAAVKAVQAGQSPSAVARAMGLYSNRIFVWLAAYRSGGWDARSRKASGRPKRLTGAQLKWIYNTVTTRNPLQLRFPFALWTRGYGDPGAGSDASTASNSARYRWAAYWHKMGLTCQEAAEPSL